MGRQSQRQAKKKRARQGNFTARYQSYFKYSIPNGLVVKGRIEKRLPISEVSFQVERLHREKAQRRRVRRDRRQRSFLR